ncbi:hydantoinase B/oxoprolinase family protein [Shinella sp.]|uniref:hydantoinase B/oxoprolinase family protein n=1 Tax=Shinella sp. TaxID=1870904 RepID=UPI0028B1D7A4|nr:hydantoinase B/oxoprolinase family protein [Shinella sp.]
MTRTDSQSGVQMAILASRIDAIARKMANTLFRTARSGVLNSGHDFSCVVLTADCRLIAGAVSLPAHVMAGPDEIARYVSEMHPVLKRGDAFLHNSPYHGNSHAADHCLVVPVIDDEGVHRYTVLAKAHQADCGNSKPTTYIGDAEDVYQEGALVFPAVQIQRNYKDVGDVIRMCQARIRVPDIWWGDYLASLGAARIGEHELLNLGKEVGWEKLAQHVENWFDYSERRITAAIGRLNSGTAIVSSKHDPFPGAPDGIPVDVKVTVDAVAGRIEVDLRDNPDCLPCGLNLTEGTSRSAALVGVFNALGDHTIPANAGAFRRLKVHLRENCVVGIPRHPFSCSVATTNLADRVASPVQVAIAQISPGFGMAEGGPIFPPAGGVISGRDPRRDDTAYVNQVHLGITGGPATPRQDGWLTLIHVGNAGLCRHDCVEVDELSYPITVWERRILTDTAGAGKFRGAPSIRVEFGPAEGASLKVFYNADGMINVAQGAVGGLSGAPTGALKRLCDGSIEPQPACTGVSLSENERIISISSGGGGYGNPAERDEDLVMSDVREGYFSPEKAKELFGVIFCVDGEIDRKATNDARRALLA